MLLFLIVYYILTFIFLILTCYNEQLKKYHLLSKCLCSIGFILAAILGKIHSSNDPLFWRLFPALIFCFLGDYFLAKREEGEQEKLFLLGLGSFLLGHCSFLFGFSYVQEINRYTFMLSLLGVILVRCLMTLKYMDVGKLKAPVLIYAYFVTALFVKCAQIAMNGNGSSFYLLVFLGGFLFFLSDGIILFLYFYQKKYGIMKFLNLLTYYSATFLLGISIFYS